MKCQPQKIDYVFKTGIPLRCYLDGDKTNLKALDYIYKFKKTQKQIRMEIDSRFEKMKHLFLILILFTFSCKKEVIVIAPPEPIKVDTTFTIVGEWITTDSTQAMIFGNEFTMLSKNYSKTFEYNWTSGYPHSLLTYYDGFKRTIKFRINNYKQIVKVEAFETVYNKK